MKTRKNNSETYINTTTTTTTRKVITQDSTRNDKRNGNPTYNKKNVIVIAITSMMEVTDADNELEGDS